MTAWHKQLIPTDRPEYAPGGVVEVFNPLTSSTLWIEVLEVLNVNGAQVLKASEGCFCACLVNTESLAMPERCAAL